MGIFAHNKSFRIHDYKNHIYLQKWYFYSKYKFIELRGNHSWLMQKRNQKNSKWFLKGYLLSMTVQSTVMLPHSVT